MRQCLLGSLGYALARRRVYQVGSVVRPINVQGTWSCTLQALFLYPGTEVIGNCLGDADNAVHSHQSLEPLVKSVLGVWREHMGDS
ncbi:hypothetical protein D3C78_1739650 [compost metagenome]